MVHCIGAFVIGLSQICSLFSLHFKKNRLVRKKDDIRFGPITKSYISPENKKFSDNTTGKNFDYTSIADRIRTASDPIGVI